MKLTVASVAFLVLCAHVHHSRAKLRAQAPLDEEEESDDWDDDEDDDEAFRKTEIDDDGRIYKNPRNSPSVMCPRDEEQAERLGQKCLRKCSTDEDCKSKKKKCHCDGACGMSCIKPDRECAELEDLENGGMIVTGHLFGDVARYTCDPNMYLVGLTERSCRADGRWTGTVPKCQKDANSFCSEPPKIINARHNALLEQTTFDLDSTVRYFCYDGYETEGFPTAKCLMKNRAPASWFGPDISCKPKNCGRPPTIANGRYAGDCHTYDCRISYHCMEGYELVGRDEKICVADGTWAPSETPQCVQVKSVQCSPPENPRNGKAIYTSCSYNSIVSYECKYGYMIEGSATRKCGADRRWSGQTPICKEINCGSPGTLYNGWIENIESGTGLGASIIFRCNAHMKLEGNTSSVCQIDGRWRYPLPNCLAPCIVPHIEHGRVIVGGQENGRPNDSFAEHGEKMVVNCKTNYEFAASKMPVFCYNGTWSAIPKCAPARCKQMPKPPKNGIVIAPKTEHGMRAVFKCKDGFELKGGSMFVECRYGTWIGEIPLCHEVFCPFPGYIENGKVLLVGNMGVYDLRPYVKKIVNNKQIMYDCDRGYVLSHGPPGATCIGGYWSPRELPACVSGQHPRLRWSRRRRSVKKSSKLSNSALPYGRVIEFFKRASRRALRSERTTWNGKIQGIDHPSVNDRTPQFHGETNETKLEGKRMIGFLETVYQKLERVDEKRGNRSKGNTSMHELLNVFSKNVFGMDIAEALRVAASRNESDSTPAPTKRKEFSEYRGIFEKEFRAYSKLMKRERNKERSGTKKMRQVGVGSQRRKQRRKKLDDFEACYEFVAARLEKNQRVRANRTVCDHSGRTESDLCTMNGTALTITDICTRFNHIIESILYSENITGTSSPTLSSDKFVPNNSSTLVLLAKSASETTTAISSRAEPMGNQIPSQEVDASSPEGAYTNAPVSFRNRKLLSVDYPLTSEEIVPSSMGTDQSRNRKPNRSKWHDFVAQRNYSNRFATPSHTRIQTFLKNSYLTAYEEGYRANVKRYMIQNNRTRRSMRRSWSEAKSVAEKKPI